MPVAFQNKMWRGIRCWLLWLESTLWYTES